MRVFATMLGFNTPEMIRGGLENLEATTTDEEHRRLIKTLFIPGYPLPNVEENRLASIKLAAEFGWWFCEIPNRGVMENHNVAIHDYCHMQEGDFYICFDPDVRMREKGWLSACIEALRSDPSVVFVCPSREFHHEQWCLDAHGGQEYQLPSGLKLRKYRDLVAWSSGVWKGEFLATRPRNFKAENPVYGYTEHADYKRRQEKTWRQLSDFHDDHRGAGAELSEWKRQSGAHQTAETFEAWLKRRGHG